MGRAEFEGAVYHLMCRGIGGKRFFSEADREMLLDWATLFISLDRAIVRGVNGATDVALVEAYGLNP